MTISARHFVDSEFPFAFRALVPAALKTAYSTVDAVYQTDELFKVRTAQIGKGYVVGWAVDREVERLIQAGKLPFDYRWASFARPTGEYLQLRLPASTMSISQLSAPAAVPRHAFFRHNRALNNAPFLDFHEFEDEREITGLPHLVLAHGYQDLWFAQVGLPHWQNAEWIYRTPNLLTAPHLVVTDEPKVEATDAEAIVTLRDDLRRWARDHANNE